MPQNDKPLLVDSQIADLKEDESRGLTGLLTNLAHSCVRAKVIVHDNHVQTRGDKWQGEKAADGFALWFP